MPVNVVKTERDERLWQEAKQQAEAEGHGGEWDYIMGIFERMKHRAGGVAREALERIMKKRKGGK